MSDSGFRERLHDAGIGEEKVEHILVELNNGQSPLHVNARSKKTESGYALHRRTPMQAMYFLVQRMEEERGLDEHESVKQTFKVLEGLKEIRDNEGIDAFRANIGLMTSNELQDFTEKVQSGELNRTDNRYEYRQASKTVLDGINDKFIGLSHQIERKQSYDQGVSHLQNMIDDTLRSHRHDINKRQAVMSAQNEMLKISVEGYKIRASIRAESSRNMEKILSRGKRITASIDRIAEKVPSKLKNKVQAKKFDNFWNKSEEGKLRRDNMVMQAALISLHTRRLLGQTNRKKVTNKDLKVGEKIVKDHMKKGTMSKARAFADVHQARHIAADLVARDKGLDREKVKVPSLKRIYASIYGTKMTAEEMTKQISLKDSGLILDPKLRREVNKKTAGLKSRPDQSPSNVRALKVDEQGVQKLRSAIRRGAEKVKLEKITDPSNQEVKDEKNVNVKKLENVMNNVEVLKTNFHSLVFEREKAIREAREKKAAQEKREKEILEKRAAEEARLKEAMGPEAYEKQRQEREDESLKQEQTQKRDPDDFWS